MSISCIPSALEELRLRRAEIDRAIAALEAVHRSDQPRPGTPVAGPSPRPAAPVADGPIEGVADRVRAACQTQTGEFGSDAITLLLSDLTSTQVCGALLGLTKRGVLVSRKEKGRRLYRLAA